MSSTAVPQHHHQQQQQSDQQQCAQFACTPRLTFWVVAGSSWLVWMFAVAAGADDKWLRDDEGDEFLAAGGDGFLDFCDDADDADDDSVYKDFCAMYRGFTAMQVLATIACSFSVLLLSVAFFRPLAGGCSSARSLAFIGGGLMATYALFQLIAVVLGGTLRTELEDAVSEALGDSVEGELGPTFGVAVTAVILATVFAVLLLLFARYAGNGPLHECCRSLMLANKANGSPATGAGGGGGGGGEKPMPTATANPAPPQYYEEAEPLPTAVGTAPAEQRQQQQQASPPPYNEVPPAAEI